MGGGIFGLSCAWEMVRRGARVRLVEAQGIGAGASGGVVGALAPHVPERWDSVKAFQFDSLLAAEPFWREVAASGGGDPGYARTGRLQPVADAHGHARALARAEGATTLWQGKAHWHVIAADHAGSWAPQSPTGWLVQDTLSARLNPAAACAALAAALRENGAEIVLGQHQSAAGPTLWATGAAGLAALNRDVGCKVGREVGRAIKGQAALLQLDRRNAPQLYADGLHVVPHADGTVAVGSTTEREFDDPESTDAQLDDVLARAIAAVPELAPAPVLRRWAGLRPRARSRAPILGPRPGHAGHFIANGGFKIGFGMAPGVARVIADLVLEDRDTIPDAFRLDACLAR
ncbi:MAG: FAD-binding oxidoreductase [Pseudomonadota bacterium]